MTHLSPHLNVAQSHSQSVVLPSMDTEEGPGGDAVALEHGYFVEDRQAVDLGVCGGHSGPGGEYHYHYDSNCMHWHDDSQDICWTSAKWD